jgi:hypothetical protein
VRSGTSCWDAAIAERDPALTERLADAGEMPARASGCVHRWQWTVMDLVNAVG